MDNDAPLAAETILMRARYQISERDCGRAAMLHARSSWPLWIWWPLSVVLPMVIATGMTIAGTLLLILWGDGYAAFDGYAIVRFLLQNPATVMLYGLLAIISGLIAPLRLYVGIPRRARRNYRRDTLAADNETEMVVRADGIGLTSSIGASRIGWSQVLKWRCNGDYVLLYYAPYNYITIPAHVGAQGFDVDRFKDMLTRHIGPAQ